MPLPVTSGRRQQLRAMADPTRLKMMSILASEPMSAAQLGRELEVSQALASYHLRRLVDAGLVELVDERPNRGAIERIYSAASAGDPVTVGVHDRDSALFVNAVLSELERRLPKMDGSRRALVGEVEVWCSPKAIKTAQDAIEVAVSNLVAAGRPAGTKGTRPVSATTFVFHLQSDPPARTL